MGFFSWNCSHCAESIMNKYTQYNDGIVLVTPNKIYIDKKYDGYGNILDKGQIQELITDLDIKIKVLHISCYIQLTEKHGFKNPEELYYILLESESAINQGYFTGDIILN